MDEIELISDGSQSNYYGKFYTKVVGINTTGILSFFWKYPHILLEKPFKNNEGYKIIEVGAGQGEHIDFVVPNYSEYLVTDNNINQLNKISLNKGYQIKTQKVDAESIKFVDNSFDRLISTCLLSHLNNPEKAIIEWRRIVRHDGYISIYLSTDPSIALRIFRKFTTKRKAKRLGFIGYDLFIAREHKNSAQSLIDIIKYNFRNDSIKIKFRPFVLRSWYLNLVCIVQVRINKKN
jgi:ubiquinone/menaquinone biosynthesis C-methylase UbiE